MAERIDDEYPDVSHDVRIVISGPFGSGKTTLAELIRRRILSLLTTHGISVEFRDTDAPLSDQEFDEAVSRIMTRSQRQPHNVVKVPPVVELLTFQDSFRTREINVGIEARCFPLEDEKESFQRRIHMQLSREGVYFNDAEHARELADVLYDAADMVEKKD